MNFKIFDKWAMFFFVKTNIFCDINVKKTFAFNTFSKTWIFLLKNRKKLNLKKSKI